MTAGLQGEYLCPFPVKGFLIYMTRRNNRYWTINWRKGDSKGTCLTYKAVSKVKNPKRRSDMFKRYLNNEKGFSMIEMMVVLIIIAVLMAGGIKFYLGYIENSRVTKAKAQISTMQAALDAYYAEKAEYPNGDELESALLNAGIKVKTPGEGGADLEQKDPWAENYKYNVSGDKYVVYTGKNDVQGKDNTYVAGRGTSGESDPPEVITTDDGEPTA
jgi:general secretion pathway protein G